jgi:predicted MFS family arabinose efflux permease
MAAVWGAGGIAGAQIAPRLLRARAEPPVLAVAAAALGLALGLVAVAPWFAIALAGLVAGGAAMAVTGVGEDLLLARRVADAVRGRVYAAHLAVVQASLAVGLLGSGALVDTLGPQAVFGIAAGSVALGVLALARLLRPGS